MPRSSNENADRPRRRFGSTERDRNRARSSDAPPPFFRNRGRPRRTETERDRRPFHLANGLAVGARVTSVRRGTVVVGTEGGWAGDSARAKRLPAARVAIALLVETSVYKHRYIIILKHTNTRLCIYEIMTRSGDPTHRVSLGRDNVYFPAVLVIDSVSTILGFRRAHADRDERNEISEISPDVEKDFCTHGTSATGKRPELGAAKIGQDCRTAETRKRPFRGKK